MIRTKAPTGLPYEFNLATTGQCTWYCYFRGIEEYGSAPTWYNGKGKDGNGKYRDATKWLEHYRTPWVPKPATYKPVHGDIVVFGGGLGHVAFIEEVHSDDTCLLSNYNKMIHGQYTKEFYLTYDWKIGTALQGTGPVKGYLHYEGVKPEGDKPKGDITTEQAITKMAEDVIAGKYGNGKLTRMNNIYKVIQRKVNELL